MSNLQFKRLRAELKDIISNPSDHFEATPINDNLYFWHFTLKGPEETEFHEGIYHGLLELSTDYPMKPPNFSFFTKNGRFETDTKICLNISKYHKESWDPSFTSFKRHNLVRNMLEALVNHFPVKDSGAIGSMNFNPEECKKLAIRSHQYVCPDCGPIIDRIKPRLIKSTEEKKEEEQKEATDKENQQEETNKSVHKKSVEFKKFQKTIKDFRKSVSSSIIQKESNDEYNQIPQSKIIHKLMYEMDIAERSICQRQLYIFKTSGSESEVNVDEAVNIESEIKESKSNLAKGSSSTKKILVDLSIILLLAIIIKVAWFF